MKFPSHMRVRRHLPEGSHIYRKVIGAAMNYRESGAPDPGLKEPIFFMKPATSVVEEGSPIKIPRTWPHVHTEVELGVVIGKTIDKTINAENVHDFIAGYQLTLDLANMDLATQFKQKAMPWFIPKAFDTSTPVSKSFIKNVKDHDWKANVQLELRINEVVKHSGNTKHLIFTIPEQIEYLSKFMTLEPGDLLLSGTPPGSTAIKPGDRLVASLKGPDGKSICMEFDVETSDH